MSRRGRLDWSFVFRMAQGCYWHQPYMTRAYLLAEIAAGVEFWGWTPTGRWLV